MQALSDRLEQSVGTFDVFFKGHIRIGQANPDFNLRRKMINRLNLFP